MEIIPIDGSSVKICLGEPDMKRLNVSCEEMNYKTTSSRRALWHVLDTVKKETGFDAALGRIEVRAMMSGDGGCELFVKRSSEGGDGVAYAKENYRISSEKLERTETLPYLFDSIDTLIFACRHLFSKDYSGESAAYCDAAGEKYYLVLRGVQKPSSSRLLRDLTFLSEFGRRCDAPCAEAYIKERCLCICRDDAVKIIAENC